MSHHVCAISIYFNEHGCKRNVFQSNNVHVVCRGNGEALVATVPSRQDATAGKQASNKAGDALSFLPINILLVAVEHLRKWLPEHILVSTFWTPDLWILHFFVFSL